MIAILEITVLGTTALEITVLMITVLETVMPGLISTPAACRPVASLQKVA
jgi:hypothetical protein